MSFLRGFGSNQNHLPDSSYLLSTKINKRPVAVTLLIQVGPPSECIFHVKMEAADDMEVEVLCDIHTVSLIIFLCIYWN